MKVAVGADAYGYPLKLVVTKWLKDNGHEVIDVGIHGMESDDKIIGYADAVAGAVSRGEAERGVLLCMSGGMMVIRANRWPKVRAVVGFKPEIVMHDREASDVNVLGLAAYDMSYRDVVGLMNTFMNTAFEALDRRVARLKLLSREAA